MIYLTRTSSGGFYNNFQVRTTNKYALSVPLTTYLYMKIVNDITKEEFFSYLYVVSSTPYFQLVNFTDTAGSQSQVGGEDIGLQEEIFHTYTIYEISNTDQTGDVTEAIVQGKSNIIERGKIFLINDQITEVSYTEYTPTDNTNTTNSNTVYLNI